MAKIALSSALMGPVVIGDTFYNGADKFKIVQSYESGVLFLLNLRTNVIFAMRGTLDTFCMEYPTMSKIEGATKEVFFKVGDKFFNRATGTTYVLATLPNGGVSLFGVDNGECWQANPSGPVLDYTRIKSNVIRKVVRYIVDFDYIPK